MNCKTFRRCGVELEFNTLSGNIHPKLPKNQAPEGATEVAHVINKAIDDKVVVSGWAPTNNNLTWVVKSDSSCGIEVCTTILKGWTGLNSLLKAQQALAKAKIVKADQRCSLHVHVNVADLTQQEFINVMAAYIKYEPIFMDSVPARRKNSRYCSPIGVELALESTGTQIIHTLQENKYFSINCYQYYKAKKYTIEFRIGENDLCLDPFSTKCWVRLLLKFVDLAKDRVYLSKFTGNPETGLAWLDIDHFMEFMEFNKEDISPGWLQVKNWFLHRVSKNCRSFMNGIWSNKARAETINYIDKNYPKISEMVFNEEDIFDEKFII